jgi:hypothetical protein
VHVVRCEVSSPNLTGVFQVQSSTPPLRTRGQPPSPPPNHIISVPESHETLPRLQQFALIGRDESISNRVPAAVASWLYLQDDPSRAPNQIPPSVRLASNVADLNRFLGTGGDRKLTVGKPPTKTPYRTSKHAGPGTSAIPFVAISMFNLHNPGVLPTPRLTAHWGIYRQQLESLTAGFGASGVGMRQVFGVGIRGPVYPRRMSDLLQHTLLLCSRFTKSFYLPCRITFFTQSLSLLIQHR